MQAYKTKTKTKQNGAALFTDLVHQPPPQVTWPERVWFVFTISLYTAAET